MARNPAFHKLLDEIKEMHDKKNSDYATDEDPLANLKNCIRLGLHPLLGTITRMQDKMCRIESFFKKGKLVNESVRDSLIDLGIYSFLAVVILDEENWDEPGRDSRVSVEDEIVDLRRRVELLEGQILGLTATKEPCGVWGRYTFFKEKS